MSAPLTELQRRLGASRVRLAALGDRLAVLRANLGKGAGNEDPRAGRAPEGASLFPSLGTGGGALDDVELTFEVLDTEDPGRDR